MTTNKNEKMKALRSHMLYKGLKPVNAYTGDNDLSGHEYTNKAVMPVIRVVLTGHLRHETVI